MFDIPEELKKLPDKPGVYIMKDESGQIIYVGKAVVLKNRVRQYFQNSANHTPKVSAMVARIKEFEYIVTDSELEALILECNLIKKHKPKFNILLKDDKHYPYIKVTMSEDYPRVLIVRRQEKDGAKYFGPYSSSYAVKETLEIIKKLFPIKTCNKVFPRDIGKGRPCLNYHIKQCLGPCTGNVSVEEYRDVISDVCSFLSGKQEEILERLEIKMKNASAALDFEKAAEFRDKINSIKHIAQKQKVLSTALEDEDVIAFSKDATDSCVQVFFVRGGKLLGREHFILEGTADVEDKELMTSFMKQFYNSSSYVPQHILIQEDIDEIKIIESWLSSKRTSKVHIRVPRRGEKSELVKMVAENATIALDQFKDRLQREQLQAGEGLGLLKDALSLDSLPLRIEAYDISNTGTSEMVASMVVFENGMPANSQYRRFKIKSFDAQNDYRAMQEVIFRRFKHASKELAEGKDEGSFTRMPDILLLDGGLGHVNAVSEVLDELGIDIPRFGMVKDDKHRTRGLIAEGQEIDLTGNLPLLRFVTSIQDEAHRFALQYNVNLRKKRYVKSALDEIDGIGPKKKKALLKEFGSVKAIGEAEVEKISAVTGINSVLAQKIKDYLGKN